DANVGLRFMGRGSGTARQYSPRSISAFHRLKNSLLSFTSFWSYALRSATTLLTRSRYFPISRLPNGEPGLRRPPPSAKRQFRPGASLAHQTRECGTDAVARAIAPKQVPDCRPGHASAAGLSQRLLDFIGNGIAQCTPEDARGRGLAVLPDRQTCFQMGLIDLVLVVEQRIDHPQADGLRLPSRRDCAEQPGLVVRQSGVDRHP